jgi:hypothetical protein
MTDLFPLITVTGNLALRVTGGNATNPGSMVADTPGTYTANGVRFVWGVIGDSFASGEGNPATGTTTDCGLTIR